jgi:hypothetical protein
VFFSGVFRDDFATFARGWMVYGVGNNVGDVSFKKKNNVGDVLLM